MSILNVDVFQSSANLSLWFKVRSGDPLNLADVPEVIPLRWQWFRDTWNFLKDQLLRSANSVEDPDYLQATIDDLTTFIHQQRESSSATNPFVGSDIYYRFYAVFDQMLVEQISLTTEEEELIDRKRKAITSFSRHDFLSIKKNLTQYRDYLADLKGLNDPDYDRIYNRSSSANTLEASAADWNLMQVIQGQISAVDFVLANLFAVDTSIDPFALARSNANNPDVLIGQYNSGFLVKLHYQEDLQALASRYLGDPNRWIDIAIANGLKEPYIDEVGEQIYFLANGKGNQVSLPGLDVNGNSNLPKLVLNQQVLVQSNVISFSTQRTITAIEQIPVSGEIIVTLDGDADLASYRLSDRANVRVYKPNTINSSQFILIPSPNPLSDNRSDEIPWFMTTKAADEKQAKIDIAVDDSGSLRFTANGDVALSYGLANAFQAIKLKLLTEIGTNRRHPNFGLVNVTGTRNLSPEDVKRKIIQSITSQVQADARFDRVETITVQQTTSGPVGYTIDLTVRLAGGNTAIPISFSVAT